MAKTIETTVTASWLLKLGTAEGAGAVQPEVRKLRILSDPLPGCTAPRRHVQEGQKVPH